MGRSTHVNVVLNADANKVLEDSALRNDRSKRKEAQVRLIDHLTRFDCTGYTGKNIKAD